MPFKTNYIFQNLCQPKLEYTLSRRSTRAYARTYAHAHAFYQVIYFNFLCITIESLFNVFCMLENNLLCRNGPLT